MKSVGFGKLRIVECLLEMVKYENVAKYFIESKIIDVTLDLIFEYPTSNILHSLLLKFIENAMTISPLRQNILSNKQFLSNICKSAEGLKKKKNIF